MLTPQERISNRLNSLTNYTRKHLTHLQSRRKNTRVNSPKRISRQTKDISIDELKGKPGYQNAPIELQRALERVGVFSPYSLLLGKCDDDLPLLLELSNPAPGSILISGDPGSGKSRLAQAIIESGTLLNEAENFHFYVIAAAPAKYTSLIHQPGFQQLLEVNDEQALRQIKQLAELIQRRQRTGPSDPVIVLVIDDLAALSDHLDYEHTRYLQQLVKHGPRSWIWPIAIVPPDQQGKVHEKILDGFRTRLIGKVSSTILASSLTGDDYSPVTDLESGSQFCVPVKDDWILFRTLK